MTRVLWLSLLILTASYLTAPVQDPDLWWHIVSGRWIVSHWSIPTQDYWNMFAVGTPWRAYSWSNEILFALAERYLGMHGLLALKFLMIFLLIVSLCYCLGRIAKDHLLGTLLGLLAAGGCYNHMTLRPQMLVWIFFVWLLLAGEDIRRKGLNRSNSLTLVSLMALWANSHISTLLGLVALGAWLYASVPVQVRGEGTPFGRFGKRSNLLLCLGLAVFGTLITPYLGGEWVTFFSKTGHPLHFSSIAEFRPATILQYSTGFLLIAAALLLYLCHRRPAALSPATLVIWGGFSAGALAVLKFIPFAVIFTCALAARVWAEDPDALGNLAEAPRRLWSLIQKLPFEGLSFLLLCLSAVNLFGIWQKPIETRVVPLGAVNFFESQNLPHPILNTFGHGGYLMYRFSDKDGEPKHLVAIDGRTNVNPAEIWDKFSSAWMAKDGWEQYLEAVKPGTILWPSGSPLVRVLKATNEWCLVYRDGLPDEGISILVRKNYWETRKDGLPSENCR